MKKISFYFRDHSLLGFLILISWFTQNQFVRPEINVVSMFETAEGVIVFQTERHGPNEEIYIMNADGSGQTRLTFNNA